MSATVSRHRYALWPYLLGRRAVGFVARRWQRRQKSRLTLEGLLFIAITFAIGLAAFNTGTNLLYLICSMLLSFLILSGVVSTNSLRGLEVSRSAPRHAVAGEPTRVEVAVRNTKRWHSSFSLRVVDCLKDGEVAGAVYVVSAPRRGTIHASYRTLFPTRGLYAFSGLRVSSRFPFGLMERSCYLARPHETLVYPRLADIRPVLRQAEVDMGDIESNKRGPGTSLYQLREYSGFEPARRIHWKTSARARRLMVMEFEKEEKRRVTLYLNNALAAPDNAGPISAAPDSRSLKDRFERAVVLTGSLAKYLLENDHQVQLITGSGKIPFGMGVSHVHRCLRALARIELFTPERHPFHLPPPEADSVNVFIHFDPERRDSIYSASAVVMTVDKWWDLLDPVATAPARPSRKRAVSRIDPDDGGWHKKSPSGRKASKSAGKPGAGELTDETRDGSRPDTQEGSPEREPAASGARGGGDAT